MLTLMRKDLRLLRPVLIAAGVIVVLFYAVLPWPGFLEDRRQELRLLHMTHSSLLGNWPYSWSFYAGRYGWQVERWAGGAWLVELVLIACVAGMAFALERRERWGELTALLPIERTRAVGVKLAVSLGVCGAMAAVNLAVMMVGRRLASGTLGIWADTIDATAVIGWTAFALAIFGTGWLASALLPSPVLATTAALATGAITWSAVMPLLEGRSAGAVWAMSAVLAGAGLLCTAAGRFVAVRRTAI